MNRSETSHPDVTGVILAGGRSTRMGQDKATLRWNGATLFEQVLRALEPVLDTFLIAGDRPDLARPNVPSFPDPYPGSALGGVYTGLIHAETPWIFVAPCDMPRACPELARVLLRERDGVDIVVPKTPAGPEPVFALYHRNCLEPIRAMLESGRFRITDLFNQMRVCTLDCRNSATDWQVSLANINTPEEFRRLAGSRKPVR